MPNCSSKDISPIQKSKLSPNIHQQISNFHQTKPTEWNNLVTIDFTENTSPKFSWQDGIYKENEIYFQVVSDVNNDLFITPDFFKIFSSEDNGSVISANF